MNLTDQNFDKEILSTNKFVLVDFFADWCQPCNILAPILEKVAEDLKDKIILAKVNVSEAPIISGKFNIDRIPNVILFKNGKEVSQFTGLIPEDAIKSWLKENIKDEKDEKSEMIERLENYAKSNGFRLNPDKKEVERVINGLLANKEKHGAKYCPCRRITGNKEEDSKKICPCFWHKDEIEKDGHCFCRLFVK